MDNALNELAHSLNTTTTTEGSYFEAILTESGTIEVICSNNTEFPIQVVMTEKQILAVTHLFKTSEVQPDKVAELNTALLELSPLVPLSSTGMQGDNYILFGAMAISTDIKEIVHELEVQAENTIDVLEAIESLLN